MAKPIWLCSPITTPPCYFPRGILHDILRAKGLRVQTFPIFEGSVLGLQNDHENVTVWAGPPLLVGRLPLACESPHGATM